MDPNVATVWIPVINLLLGAVGFGWLTIRTVRRRSEYPGEVMLLLRLTLALFFGLLFVSLEMVLRTDVPLASAVIVSCVKVYALFVLALTRTTKYRTGTRTFDGNRGANPNRDV